MRYRILFVGSIITICLTQPGPSAPAPQDEYVFVQDLDRWVGIHRGRWTLIGKLNADGDFIQEHKISFGAGHTQIPFYTTITFVIDGEPKPAYELRAGRLIKGVMTRAGTFVPEIGSAIIKFEDYKYSPTAIRIWNLPGGFMRKDVADKLKKGAADKGKDEKK